MMIDWTISLRSDRRWCVGSGMSLGKPSGCSMRAGVCLRVSRVRLQNEQRARPAHYQGQTTRREIDRRSLIAPELPVGEARQVERLDPKLMPGELAFGVVDYAAVQA